MAKRGPKKATVHDIARAAGVSIATVSRTLSRPDDVRAETRERVLEQVRVMGYRVNRLAADFRLGNTRSILVLVSNIANPFFSEFFKGMEHQAREEGYVLLIGDTAGDETKEQEYADMLISGKVDGIVLNLQGVPKSLMSLLEQTGSSDLPLMSCNDGTMPDMPVVRIDNDLGGRMLAEHLLELGHATFAQITGPLESDSHQRRYKGFNEAIGRAGHEMPDDQVIEGDLSVEFGRRSAHWFASLAGRPTAIFVHNDETAIGLVHELSGLGISVPGDVSVVGYDDLQFSGAMNPSLTTVRLPRREWGAATCRHMVSVIEDREIENREIVIRPELIIRESSAAPRR